MYIWGSCNMRPTIKQLRLIYSELRRREQGSGTWKGRWEDQIFGEQRFVVPGRDNGTWRGIWISRKPTELWVPACHTLAIFLVPISGDISLSHAFYLNSFRQVRESRSYSWIWWIWFSSAQNSPAAKAAHSERLALNPFRIIELPCVIKRKLLFHPCTLICFRILFPNFFLLFPWENHSYLFGCMASAL